MNQSHAEQRHSHHMMPHKHHDHGAHTGHDKHAGHSPEIFQRRFFVCLALTLPVLYFAPSFQQWFGYQAVQFPGSGLVSPLLSIVIYGYGGWVFLRGAWIELHSKIGMMTLIALAITVAFTYSLAVSLGLEGEPFYWELATLVDVMLLGHWIEMASVQGASRALEHLANLTPAMAHRLASGQVEEVPVERLQTNDTLLVKPGEQVPIDGEVIEGASSVNEAFLTGESRPVNKQVGDEAVGGSVNGEGALTLRVIRTGEQTTLSQIMRLVEEAQSSRSQYQVLADQLAYWLTLIAIGVGALTFVVWLSIGPALTFAINRAVTVLVITCPHALGLAIPLVIVNATSLSARHGIIVRNREAFERARQIRAIAFDKTGTLTEGEFGVRHIFTDRLNETDALEIAASLETFSEHPLAAAIVQEAHARQLSLPGGSDFQAVAGKGVEGRVKGQFYRVGRPEWADELSLSTADPLKTALMTIAEGGESAIALMDETRLIALFGLADKVRVQARKAVDQLQKMGLQVVMITGDAETVAKTVAGELGIDRYYSRVLPQDKASLIRNLKSEMSVAFVGDGINDAPALLEANLALAIGAGTNVAIESADLVLIKSDPLDATYALKLAKATYAKMLQNLFWATGYNVIGIPLAAGVAYPLGILLSPAVGAIFMSISTVVVSINAMLLRRVKLGTSAPV
ncbi:MAG: heavy metal translocating P-type ATPase [Leptolyngbyaceae cyanobacterium MO_188.B28]|nr:heavy metal translocating P-type ATPase [Leptolyngbyaceae cyanobacterium MO_188.B28]